MTLYPRGQSQNLYFFSLLHTHPKTRVTEVGGSLAVNLKQYTVTHEASINGRQTEKFHLGDKGMMIMMVVVEVGAKIKSPFDEPIMAKKKPQKKLAAVRNAGNFQ